MLVPRADFRRNGGETRFQAFDIAVAEMLFETARIWLRHCEAASRAAVAPPPAPSSTSAALDSGGNDGSASTGSMLARYTSVFLLRRRSHSRMAMMMPQRLPGRPNFDKLMHSTMFEFHSGVAWLKIIPGKGTS